MGEVALYQIPQVVSRSAPTRCRARMLWGSGYRREAARPLPRATQTLEGKNVSLNLMVKS
jgi:hypothetical protein